MCIYAQSTHICNHPGPLTLLYSCAHARASSTTSNPSSSSTSHIPQSRFRHTPPLRTPIPCPTIDTLYTASQTLSTVCSPCQTRALLTPNFSSFRGAWARILDTSDPVNTVLDAPSLMPDSCGQARSVRSDPHFLPPTHGGQVVRKVPEQEVYAPKCCEGGWTDTKSGRGARPGEFMDSKGWAGGFEGRVAEERARRRQLDEEFAGEEEKVLTGEQRERG